MKFLSSVRAGLVNKIDPPSPSSGAASIVVIEGDVRQPRDIERIVATTLAQFKGHLDVLVNNASTIGPSDAELGSIIRSKFSRSARHQLNRGVSLN